MNWRRILDLVEEEGEGPRSGELKDHPTLPLEASLK